MDINQKITQELGVQKWQVDAAVKLIDEDYTIPFIARYRKEATGTLNDEQLRKLHERLLYLRNLEEKKEQVLSSIEEQGKLTEELKRQILAAETMVVVEDLYRPYRPKRRTRAMIAKEKDLDVDTKVTTVLFNNKVDILTDRSNINSLSDMTTKDYRVGGSTALLDAVGNTIAKISDTPGISDKDHKVIFVIITDGLENASTEYSKATIQKMISDKKAQGWDFIFLGANIDAASEAQNLGIDADHAVKYRNTSTGVQKNFAAIAAYCVIFWIDFIIKSTTTATWRFRFIPSKSDNNLR